MGLQTALASALLYGSMQQSGLLSVTDLTRAPAWSLTNANGSVSVSNAALPAYVLEVLEKRNIIPDPLQRFNEKRLAWVRDDTWTFSREFTLSAPWTGGELVLAGVDTVADITLNGQRLGRVASEHRTHRLAVPAGLLRSNGANKISIELKPVKQEAQKDQNSYAYTVPSVAHLGSFAEHKAFIRKAGSDFGWDWGPALGPVGVFGSIYLLAAPAAPEAGSYLQAAHIRQLHRDDKIQLKVHAVVSKPATGSDANAPAPAGTAKFVIPELSIDVSKQFSGSEDDFKEGGACRRVASGEGGSRAECNVFVEVDVPKSQVELWWPAGHGPQRLYDATVTWQPAGGAASCSDAATLDADDPAALESKAGAFAEAAAAAPAPAQQFGCSAAKRLVGFRTVELVTQPLAEAAKEMAPGAPAPTGGDAEGESMYFRVNGIPMFLKGANLIPFHTVRTQVTPELMNGVLKAATDVHFNVLRVWGGGIYQTDAFYTACDRLGLLVWQEAMFACAMYPADTAFLADVREEMREQVLRIGHHPSVALWGGNNENEAAFGWFSESRNDRAFYQKDYVKLYFDTVGDEIVKLDPERPFIDSSPANGPFYPGATAEGKLPMSLDEVLRTKRWGDAGGSKFGDMHFYENYNDCTAPGVVPVARIMSEFGWQSDAPFFSIKSVTPAQDWDTWAETAQYRQRWLSDGTRLKVLQMGKVFGGLPSHNFMASEPQQKAKLYSDYIYLRQVMQSVCYDHTISMMRRNMHNPAKMSMGTLYWQLNDVWQGASWSSFDYEGRWKPLHHALSRVYAPLQLQAFVRPEDDTAAVLLSYDEAAPLPAGVAVDVYLHSLSAGNAPASANATAACLAGDDDSAPKALVGSFKVDAGEVLTAKPSWSLRVDEVLAKLPGCGRGTCFLRAVAREAGAGGVKGARARGGQYGLLGAANGRGRDVDVQEAVLFFDKFNSLALPEVSVRPHSFKKVAPKTIEFQVTAAGGAAAHAFWDAAPAGRFSVNGVQALRPCAPLAVRFEAADEVEVSDLESSLTIWTINGALQGKQRAPLLGVAGRDVAAARRAPVRPSRRMMLAV